MISELLALVTGAFLGSVVTASIYRSSQATNVRKAVASVQRYLSSDGHKAFGPLTAKLKLHLDIINEADDLVARSQWAKKHKHRFVAQSVHAITLRNKGITRDNKNQLIEAQAMVKESGEMLLGYMEFPSWRWLKATSIRLVSGSRRRIAARKAPAAKAVPRPMAPRQKLVKQNS